MTTTQVEAIIGLAVTLLKTVPGTGNVYPQLMYARTEKEFNDLWTAPPFVGETKRRVATWMITSGKESRRLGPTHGFVFETIPLSLFGYLDVQQVHQSELFFNGLTERVADAFDTSFKLGDEANVLTAIMNQTPAQVVYRKYAKFGSVLCHVAQIDVSFTVQRQFKGQ